MTYFLDLVSTETWPNFLNTDKRVAGFKESLRNSAEHVNPGDIFLCYLTGLSRWCGALEVQDKPYVDHHPRPGYGPDDPFSVRFEVKPRVVLDIESAIPIKDCAVWSTLTFTKHCDKGSSHWTGRIRKTLSQINDGDGEFLLELLKEQQESPKSYPLTAKDKHLLARIRKALPRSGG